MNNREQRLLYALAQAAHEYLYYSAADALDNEFITVKQDILNALAEYDLVTVENLRTGRWTQAGLDLLNSKRQIHPSLPRSSPPSEFQMIARPISSSPNIFCEVVADGEATAIGRYNFLSLPRVGDEIAVTPPSATQEKSLRVVRVIHSPFEAILAREQQWVPIRLVVAPA